MKKPKTQQAESETFTLTLQHAPNPDIGDRDGYWQPTVNKPREIVTMVVTNLRDARTSFEAWRDANGIGGGNMTKRSGRLTRKNGRLVGRFSYNGRFWNPEGKEVHIG
jgi:hypothetical protein